MKKNNSPFSYQGRMTRLPFVLTSIVYFFIFGFINLLMKGTTKEIERAGAYGDPSVAPLILLLLAYVFLIILVFFAWIKRLRDLRRRWWMSFVCLIPLVSVPCAF